VHSLVHVGYAQVSDGVLLKRNLFNRIVGDNLMVVVVVCVWGGGVLGTGCELGQVHAAEAQGLAAPQRSSSTASMHACMHPMRAPPTSGDATFLLLGRNLSSLGLRSPLTTAWGGGLRVGGGGDGGVEECVGL